MPAEQILEADLTWTGRGFEPEIRIQVSARGRIEAVGRDLNAPTRRLSGRALLPGFVNVHSHAFQRGLRGLGETFPAGSGSFWGWRDGMYGLVESLDPQSLHELSLRAFSDMLAAGITTVGEFHYLHHDSSGAGYAMDEAVREAARDSGIRLVLLETYYKTGGIDQPLTGGQKRFHTGTPADYWRQVDRLASRLSPGQTLGAAVHSVRAAPLEEIREIRREAKVRRLPFHMHVEEQRREIEDCNRRYGANPMALLVEKVGIGDDFTAVHCTHTQPTPLRAFLDHGGTVCICPVTEANLGDGVADLPVIESGSGRIAVGTDSNSRICFLEELRWLEYAQRLRLEKRGVLLDDEGSSARRLLRAATSAGARSLGVQTGAIEPGRWADFLTVDLGAADLAGTGPENLLDALVFGCGNGVIDSVCVGGRWVSG